MSPSFVRALVVGRGDVSDNPIASHYGRSGFIRSTVSQGTLSTGGEAAMESPLGLRLQIDSFNRVPSVTMLYSHHAGGRSVGGWLDWQLGIG